MTRWTVLLGALPFLLGLAGGSSGPDREAAGFAVEPLGAPGGRIEVASGRIVLRRGARSWRATLQTSRYGCQSRLAPVDRSGGSPLREWYARDPRGIEHGFTLEESPCSAPGEVVIEERIEGLHAVDRPDRRGVDLRDEGGTVRAHYTDLAATDARGAPLSSWMEATATGVLLHVDARDALFPVQVDPLAWFETHELVDAAGAAGDHFGTAVRISGTTAIVGIPAASAGNPPQPDAGAACVYVMTASGWQLQQRLEGDPGTSSNFGGAVALDGDTAMIGAPSPDPTASGTVYVFVRSGAVWNRVQKIPAPPGAPSFGVAIAISGSTALIGAGYSGPPPPGSPTTGVYVFTSSASGWTQQQVLQSSDEAPGDGFGTTLALSGTTAIVGAPDAIGGLGNAVGAAYVFTASGSTFTQQQKLVASDASIDDQFGGAIALSGNTAAIAAPGVTVGGNVHQGAVYVFSGSAGGFVQQQKLVVAGGQTTDNFGTSVALSGGMLLVGTPRQGRQGQAYVFAPAGGTWSQTQQLSASDGAPGDEYGTSISLDGQLAVIGAPVSTVGSNQQQGSAYVEQLLSIRGSTCSADAECGSGHCVDGLCCDSSCALPCEACDVPAAPGTCTPVTGPPHGSRPACTSVGPLCGGRCDGSHADACQYPPAATPCDTACSSAKETVSTCDGHGTCVAAEPAACRNNLQCDPASNACRTSCAADSDCVAGYVCAGGDCHAGAVCLDGHTSQGRSGIQDCGAYACNAASGACNAGCATVDDCSAPNVCEPGGTCVPPPDTSVAAGGGCSVSATRDDRGPPWLLALASLGIAGASLRTRSARRSPARRRPGSSS